MVQVKSYLKDRRILMLIVVVAALALLDLHYGIHLGIEFVGGTEIPLTLQHSVNTTEMSSLISVLQQRLATFGLRQVTVEGIGNSAMYVIVPSTTSGDINATVSIIEKQGRFDGVVNGVAAINGSSILHGSIGSPAPIVANGTATWLVTFYVTQVAATRFAHVVFGQGNKPLYMFLDRPSNSIILISSSQLGNLSSGLPPSQALSAIQNALSMGNETIPVLSVSDSNQSIASAESFINSSDGKYNNIIASSTLNGALISYLAGKNYTVHLESKANMTPTFQAISSNETIVESWPVVGLLSAPLLNPSITNGNVTESYEISGAAPAGTPKSQLLSYAQNQTKTIASILTGGALPVAVVPGTPTNIPPTLGADFLNVSELALIMAVIAISIFITIRYRRVFLVFPILITTFMELFIIVSIIGLVGTIDLAAVAGMIAVVGTGVDAQIIITDEIVTKGAEGTSAKKLLGNAFYIVWADAGLLVAAMLPLFFATSLVSIIGFSESTIIGALLGVLITRPAYGAIISRHYG